MIRKSPLILSIVALLLSSAGCFCTFRSFRVVDDSCPFKGIPASVYRPYLAIVTWDKEQDGKPITTQHYCRLPVLYGVDVMKAPLGKTTGEFTFGEDGQLTKSHADVDQQVDEIITSVTEAGKLLGAGGQRGGDSVGEFMPKISDTAGALKANPISISFHQMP